MIAIPSCDTNEMRASTGSAGPSERSRESTTAEYAARRGAHRYVRHTLSRVSEGTAIAFEGTSKRYRSGTLALRDVSWSIPVGARACLLGPNGSGKTTSIRLLEGALAPTAGRVGLLGRDVRGEGYVGARSRTGIVPQMAGMYADLTVAEYLELTRRLYGRGDVPRTLDAFGLGAQRDKLLAQLSGGFQRRVVIASALLSEPDLLLLDEPTVGLDPVAAHGDARRRLPGTDRPMRTGAIAALLWKETRQIGRNRTALLTATFLPFIILFVAPIQLLIQFKLVGARGLDPTGTSFPGFAGVRDPIDLLIGFIYPLLFVLGGLLLPSLTTAYATVAERERRSLELLVSLPVSVSEILTAKLLAVLLVTALVGLPYVAVVLTLLLVLGVADATTVPALLVPFAAAVTCSTAISLLLTLLARDFRTA